MSCRYVYDESASLTSPLTRVVGSIGGNPSTSRSGSPTSSMYDFQMPVAYSSFLSHSEYDIPLIYNIDGPPRHAQAHPHPSSPLASPQAPVDRAKPHTRLGTNRQRYPGRLRGGSIDPEKLDCIAGSSKKVNDSLVRELAPNAHGDLFDSQSSFTNIYDNYGSSSSSASGSGRLPGLSVTNPSGERGGLGKSGIDTAVSGTPMNSSQQLPGSGAVQDSLDASKRASFPKAPDSLLHIVGTTPATNIRNDRQRLKDSSNRTVSNTAPTVSLRRWSTLTTCTAPFASGAVATGRMAVPSSTVTLSLPSAEFAIFFDSPLVEDRGGAARSSGLQNAPSSQALASQSSFNSPRTAEGKAEKAVGWTTSSLGVEDGPYRLDSHRNAFGGVWSSGERSDMSPFPQWQSSTSGVHMRSANGNLNCSRSGTSGLSRVGQPLAVSEPSPMAFHEGHHLSLRRTVQPSMQPASPVHTFAGAHEVGNTDGSGYNDRDTEEADGSPLAHQPVYDLSCVAGSLEETAEVVLGPPHFDTDDLDGGGDGYDDHVNRHGEAEEGALLTLAEPPSSVLSARHTKNQPPTNSTALPKATSPARTPRHAPPTLSKRLLTLGTVRTDASAMMESGNVKLSLDGGTGAKQSDEEVASESSASSSMTPSYLTDLSTPLSPASTLTTRVPRSPLQNARNERALGTVVTAETPHLSTSRHNTNAAALDDKAPQTDTTQSRRAGLPSTKANHPHQGSAQAMTTSSRNPNSSKPKSREMSEAVTVQWPSPSPVLRMRNSVQPRHATVLSGELQKLRRQLYSRVRICAGTHEIDDSPMASKAPWPLPTPPSSIVVKRRLFDPNQPRLRSPRTRELPNGRRRANWTAPETHYTTTLADLAACDEDEDDVQQWRLTDALWSDEVIGMDAAVSQESEIRDSRPSSSSTPAVESGVVGAMVLNRSPASTSRVRHMSSLPPATSSTSLKAPAVATTSVTIPGGLQLARMAPLTATASRDAHASAIQESHSTSVKVGGRTGGIVVDEVDKVLRLRKESKFTQVLGELQSEQASRPSHDSGAPMAQAAPRRRG